MGKGSEQTFSKDDTQTASQHRRDARCHQPLQKRNQNQQATAPHASRNGCCRQRETPGADKDVEKPKPRALVAGTQNGAATRKPRWFLKKLQMRRALGPAIPLLHRLRTAESSRPRVFTAAPRTAAAARTQPGGHRETRGRAKPGAHTAESSSASERKEILQHASNTGDAGGHHLREQAIPLRPHARHPVLPTHGDRR